MIIECEYCKSEIPYQRGECPNCSAPIPRCYIDASLITAGEVIVPVAPACACRIIISDSEGNRIAFLRGW